MEPRGRDTLAGFFRIRCRKIAKSSSYPRSGISPPWHGNMPPRMLAYGPLRFQVELTQHMTHHRAIPRAAPILYFCEQGTQYSTNRARARRATPRKIKLPRRQFRINKAARGATVRQSRTHTAYITLPTPEMLDFPQHVLFFFLQPSFLPPRLRR